MVIANIAEIDDFLLKAHDKAMSKDDTIAVEGRAMKAVTNFLTTWLESEIQRGTSNADLMEAALSIGLSVVTSTAATICQDKAEAVELLTKTQRYTVARWKHSLRSLKTEGEAGR